MALQQVNLRVEAELLQRLRMLARERGLSLNAVAGMAFEQLLQATASNQNKQSEASPSADQERRLAALEARVAKLETVRSVVAQAPPSASPEPAATQPSAWVKLTPEELSGAITTADLAAATGTNRAAWNNWARDKNPGAVRKMKPEVGNWRYLGKAPSETGGPDRGLWERA